MSHSRLITLPTVGSFPSKIAPVVSTDAEDVHSVSGICAGSPNQNAGAAERDSVSPFVHKKASIADRNPRFLRVDARKDFSIQSRCFLHIASLLLDQREGNPRPYRFPGIGVNVGDRSGNVVGIILRRLALI